MFTATMTELQDMDNVFVLSHIPMLVTFKSGVTLLLENPEFVIPLRDMHPRVRTILKIQEQKARQGMPPPTPLEVIKKEAPPVLELDPDIAKMLQVKLPRS